MPKIPRSGPGCQPSALHLVRWLTWLTVANLSTSKTCCGWTPALFAWKMYFQPRVQLFSYLFSFLRNILKSQLSIKWLLKAFVSSWRLTPLTDIDLALSLPPLRIQGGTTRPWITSLYLFYGTMRREYRHDTPTFNRLHEKVFQTWRSAKRGTKQRLSGAERLRYCWKEELCWTALYTFEVLVTRRKRDVESVFIYLCSDDDDDGVRDHFPPSD